VYKLGSRIEIRPGVFLARAPGNKARGFSARARAPGNNVRACSPQAFSALILGAGPLDLGAGPLDLGVGPVDLGAGPVDVEVGLWFARVRAGLPEFGLVVCPNSGRFARVRAGLPEFGRWFARVRAGLPEFGLVILLKMIELSPKRPPNRPNSGKTPPEFGQKPYKAKPLNP